MGNGYRGDFAGLGREFRRAGKLRRHIHNLHQPFAVLPQLAETGVIRVLQVGGILGAPFVIGEIGSLHMDAPEHAAPLGGFFGEPQRRGKGRGQYIIGQGHGSGGEGGNAAGGVECRHLHQALIVAVGKVPVGGAVAVHLYKARNHGGPMQIHRVLREGFRQDPAEPAVLYLKAAHAELKVGTKNTRVFIEHGVISFRWNDRKLCYQLLPAGKSRVGKGRKNILHLLQ